MTVSTHSVLPGESAALAAAPQKRRGLQDPATVMNILPWMCNSLVLGSCVAAGYLQPSQWLAFLALLPLMALAMVGMRRLAARLKWSEPVVFSLTIALAVMPGNYAYWQIDSVGGRSAMILMLLAPLAYGVLSMTTGRLMVLVAVLLANHFAVIAAMRVFRPEVYSYPGDTLMGVAIAMVGSALAGLGGLLYGLRRRVHSRSRELRDAMARLSDLASRDDLTGLPNRRTLMEDVAKAFASRQPCSVVLLDIDHFKRINDTWGHHVGDEVLRRVAQAARQVLAAEPEGLSFGRYGGEEFLLVMREMGARAALAPAARLQLALARIDFSDVAPTLQVTVSAGLASRRPDEVAARLLAAADAQLYEAKAQGRNRLCRREELA